MTTYFTVALVIYAAILLLGAVFGARAKSRISCIMGTVSGAILLGCAWAASHNPETAAWISSGLGALLTVIFVKRLKQTRRWMPAGGLLLISVSLLILSLGFLMIQQ